MGRPAKSSKAPGNSPKPPAPKATRSTDVKKPTKSTSETPAPKASKSTAAKPSQSTSETPAPKPSRSNVAKPSISTSETPAPKPSKSNAAESSKSTSETPAPKPSKSNAAEPSKSTSETRAPKPSKSNAVKPSKSTSKTPTRKSFKSNAAKLSESTSETRIPPVKKVLEQVPPKVYAKNYNDSNNNIVLFLNQAQKGRLSLTDSRRMRQLAVIKDAKTFKVIRMDHIFERRVTSLTWHPTISNMIGVASKGGGMMLARIYPKTIDIIEQYPGIGPGGSILALKFHPSVKEAFFTASLDGTVCYRNYQNKLCIQYLSTGDYSHWFTSFDLSEETGVMLAGDTKGIVTILNKDGSKESATKIQKTGKVHHIEFCPRNSRLFVTASADKCVKLWDLRKFDQKAEPIFTFLHEKPVNSAYFSRTDSNYLLTTDQGSELRVFQAPNWDLVNILPHPHRQFQHITPIKATWHPLEDIVVCGRYPDKKFPGYTVGELPTVDFMCPVTGQMLYQLHHPGFSGLFSLNQFNNNGTLLGTGAGGKCVIWAPHPKTIPELSSKKRKRDDEDKDEEDEDEEEEETPKRKPKKFDFQKPSTSTRVLDSLPVNRRCGKTDGKKKAKTKE